MTPKTPFWRGLSGTNSGGRFAPGRFCSLAMESALRCLFSGVPRFVPICSVFLRFVPICFQTNQNKSGKPLAADPSCKSRMRKKFVFNLWPLDEQGGRDARRILGRGRSQSCERVGPAQGSKSPKSGKEGFSVKKHPFPNALEKGTLSQKIPIFLVEPCGEMGIL